MWLMKPKQILPMYPLHFQYQLALSKKESFDEKNIYIFNAYMYAHKLFTGLFCVQIRIEN